ncbi:MAG: hypothetical protein OXK76_03865 [Gammaproteobacteria bacterium]|nr:hypothetical protein [Gammaproteobacteria bacterium]
MGTARLKQELMGRARDETLGHGAGASSPAGRDTLEQRTVKAIRPDFAPSPTP